MSTQLPTEPTYKNQLIHARHILATQGREALDNPHGMTGRSCGCKGCFCCAAAQVVAEHDEEATKAVTPTRVFTCGTRAVIPKPDGTYRVVCATCGAGGSVPHKVKEDATRAAVRDSNRPCTACGAH